MTKLSQAERREMVRRACEARRHAYAHYSGYRVGAALLTKEGHIFVGANVENASFGLTNCAERTAVFSAIAAGHREFRAVAVASPGRHAPCGACRQVLVEFGRDLTVLLVDPRHPEDVEETSMTVLLPRVFELPLERPPDL